MSLIRVDNPPNPWLGAAVEWIGEPPPARLTVYTDQTKSILSKNDSPDLPFRWSVNPYRGCFHGCTYCYARPSHEYLGFGAGTDFERQLVTKPEAARLLEAAFDKPGWAGEMVLFSGNTDCYQPLEASLRLTRACLDVCRAYQNPVAIITKSPLIERDLDVLVELSERAWLQVSISIPLIEARDARALEPAVPPPARRLETIRRLAAAGLTVGVSVSPLIPGLSDSQVAEVLTQARDAGASFAWSTMLRLPGPVADHFERSLRRSFPDRAARIMARVREVHGGRTYAPAFGQRMTGAGVYADAVHTLFELTRTRLGYQDAPECPTVSPFRRPVGPGGQLSFL